MILLTKPDNFHKINNINSDLRISYAQMSVRRIILK